MIRNTFKITTVQFFFLLTILYSTLGKLDEIFLRRTSTRTDLIELSMAIWSGFFSRRSYCASKCTQEPDCVSLLYNMADGSCDLFNVIYDSDNGGDVDYYWVLEDRGTRWVPESCFTVANCSGITTDGEYWVYPIVTNRKRTKIYCHNLPTEPSHFISLPKTCVFTHHDRTNWIIWMRECQSSFIPPLKQTEFLKVKMQIENMIVNETDYTFTSTGSSKIKFGKIKDCNGRHFINPCPHFSKATIDTSGTGLIIDPRIEFGRLPGSTHTAVQDFERSALGDQISFTCAGWCGSCGPISGLIRFQHSTEFISAADAEAIICHK